MHTFGHPCKIEELLAIAHDYKLKIVEDSAESLGSFYEGQHTGTFGLFGIFSSSKPSHTHARVAAIAK